MTLIQIIPACNVEHAEAAPLPEPARVLEQLRALLPGTSSLFLLQEKRIFPDIL